MRVQGRIIQWDDTRGAGVVSCSADGEPIEIDIAAFERWARRPGTGDLVTYELKTGTSGRRCAERIALIDRHRRDLPNGTGRVTLIAAVEDQPPKRREAGIWLVAYALLFAAGVWLFASLNSPGDRDAGRSGTGSAQAGPVAGCGEPPAGCPEPRDTGSSAPSGRR